MIPLLTRDAVRSIDGDAIKRLGVSGLVLMENAGAGAARMVLSRFADRLSAPLVVGGTGQNGGDAWVLARHLVCAGCSPRCVLVGARQRVQGDALVQLLALEALGCGPEEIDEHTFEVLVARLGPASLVVDGLFGTGLDRPIQGLHARVIERLNAGAAPIVALDLPSGIDANTGQVLGIAVRAVATATFAAHKRGLHQYPGVEHAGHVELVSIGVPATGDTDCGLIEARDVAGLLRPRPGDAHKGTGGHVLVLAGSSGKTGAALLSATGALRAGAGLATIATTLEACRALEQKVLEVMTAPLEGDDLVEAALALAANKASAVLGPGLGLDQEPRARARALAVRLPIPCVLDADALTAVGPDLSILQAALGPRVLTPHPGEAARLLGCSTQQVAHDRFAAAAELAQGSGHVAVLKGARTIIASPDGRTRVCASGTPALGTAGTGDVLAGAIAALCATCDPFDAAWAAVELNAQAAELAAKSDRGLLASEVAGALPRALERCRAAAWR